MKGWKHQEDLWVCCPVEESGQGTRLVCLSVIDQRSFICHYAFAYRVIPCWFAYGLGTGVWHFDQKLLEEEAWRKETPWSSRGGKLLKDQIRRRGATKRCGCLEGIAWRLGLCSSSRTDHVAWMHWEAVELVMLLLWLGVLVACRPLQSYYYGK